MYSSHGIYYSQCDIYLTRRQKMEVEVGKLSKQLEQVKSLLCEVAKHIPHQQGAPAALDQVPSDARDEQPSQQ